MIIPILSCSLSVIPSILRASGASAPYPSGYRPRARGFAAPRFSSTSSFLPLFLASSYPLLTLLTALTLLSLTSSSSSSLGKADASIALLSLLRRFGIAQTSAWLSSRLLAKFLPYRTEQGDQRKTKGVPKEHRRRTFGQVSGFKVQDSRFLCILILSAHYPNDISTPFERPSNALATSSSC